MRYRFLLLLAATAVALVGCVSHDSTAGSNYESELNAGTFVLTEFKVALVGNIPSGAVEIKVENRGSETHELVIVSAQNAESLPKKADGSVDEDQIPEEDKLGETGDIEAHTTVTQTFDLAPGNYVAFCNIVDSMSMDDMGMMGGATSTSMGHGHFVEGMHLDFTVK
jgi:plastocyanin